MPSARRASFTVYLAVELARSGATGTFNATNITPSPVWTFPWQVEPEISYGKRVPLKEGDSYHQVEPADYSQIDKVTDMYESLGVDRLGTWMYRGGYGTSVSSNCFALEQWDNIGRNYRRVLKK